MSIWIYMFSSLLRIHEHILPEGLLKLNYAKCLTKVSWNFFSVSFLANLTTMHNFLYFYFSAGHNWKLVVLYPPTRPFSYLASQGTSITTIGSTKPHLPFIIQKESLLLPTDHDEGGSSNHQKNRISRLICAESAEKSFFKFIWEILTLESHSILEIKKNSLYINYRKYIIFLFFFEEIYSIVRTIFW